VRPRSSEPRPRPADWGVAGGSARLAPATAARVALPSLAATAIIGWVAGPAAGALALCACAGASGLWIALQGRRALRALGAARIEPAAAPRLVNIVTGLARDLGMHPPGLWLVVGAGPNALVVRAPAACLCVTPALLESFTRTELEATVAHCLVRLQRSGLWRESAAAAFGAGVAGGGIVGADDDVRAAAVTRYPPALAAAVSKAEPVGRFEPFWFYAEGPWHEPRSARLRALADL
jgi:hypothetical protein